MKGLVRFYPAQKLEWTKKDTGEVKQGWKQNFDLDQGEGIRPLQSETMHMDSADVQAPGDYDADFYIDKDRRGFLSIQFFSLKLIKTNKPQVVNG